MTPEEVTDAALDAYAENLYPEEERAFRRNIDAGNWRSLIIDAIEADRAQRGIVAQVAEALDGRGATAAAQLVRDTDPDDDLWNNYIGPMIDSIEDDYAAMAAEMED